MNRRVSKYIYIVISLVLAIYIGYVFFAMPQPKAEAKCRMVSISIEDAATNGFITVEDIQKRLKESGLYPIDLPLSKISSRNIEEMLRRSPFVNKVDCYKTVGGSVNISITQRMPIVRIKAEDGADYYLDDHKEVMPKSDYSSDLIVATGNINNWYAKNYISVLADVLNSSEFWSNQIVQINVLSDEGVELVPRVGDHIVYIGRLPQVKDATRREEEVRAYVESKLDRLDKFYRYGLPYAGWNKYDYINLEFSNQIICRKHEQEKMTQSQDEEMQEARTVDNMNEGTPDNGEQKGIKENKKEA